MLVYKSQQYKDIKTSAKIRFYLICGLKEFKLIRVETRNVLIKLLMLQCC